MTKRQSYPSFTAGIARVHTALLKIAVLKADFMDWLYFLAATFISRLNPCHFVGI